MNVKMALSFFLISISICCYAQQNSAIRLPHYNDPYARAVIKLDSGNFDGIDFTQFRESFLESAQFNFAHMMRETILNRTAMMLEKFTKAEYQEAIKSGNVILGINYTHGLSHLILGLAYGYLKDSEKEIKHGYISRQLANSIKKSGEGISCETAWQIIDNSEIDYLILTMGAENLNSSPETKLDNICSKVKISVEGNERMLYFDAQQYYQALRRVVGRHVKTGMETGDSIVDSKVNLLKNKNRFGNIIPISDYKGKMTDRTVTLFQKPISYAGDFYDAIIIKPAVDGYLYWSFTPDQEISGYTWSIVKNPGNSSMFVEEAKKAYFSKWLDIKETRTTLQATTLPLSANTEYIIYFSFPEEYRGVTNRPITFKFSMALSKERMLPSVFFYQHYRFNQ